MILTIINLIYVFCFISMSSWKLRVLPVFDTTTIDKHTKLHKFSELGSSKTVFSKP